MDSLASVFGLRSYSQEEVATELNVPVAELEKQRAEVAAGGGPRGIAARKLPTMPSLSLERLKELQSDACADECV